MRLEKSKDIRCVRTSTAFVQAIDHVLRSAMIGRGGRELEGGRTQAALEGSFTRVNGHVIAQSLGGQERLRTH